MAIKLLGKKSCENIIMKVENEHIFCVFLYGVFSLPFQEKRIFLYTYFSFVYVKSGKILLRGERKL